MAQAQGGGQPQQGAGSQFDANQNPFQSILDGLKQQEAQPSQQPQGPQPIMTASGPQMPPNQLEPGKNPSGARPLTQAISALQNYIAQSTNRDNILIARNVIKLLTSLVSKEEDTQLGNLQQGY